MPDNRIYAAIDLKSFYRSVECMRRGLDPLNTNLVVADKSRTNKTICLAVSPSLKRQGIPGRPRLFEVEQKVKSINDKRLSSLRGRSFAGKTVYNDEWQSKKDFELDYIVAPPQMAKYIEISSQIYGIYLKYISPEDIHVYSIDEVFMDLTGYLETYNMTAHELVTAIVRDINRKTGITATAGIGTNLYLAKVAMDIVAKHVNADADGVRIAELDEYLYRKLLWAHEPLTDFWRIGRGIAKKLNDVEIYTMGDIAGCSLGGDRDFYNENLLYKLFGINAELIIDHAWGWEPTTIRDIKGYKPENSSTGIGQVLTEPYDSKKRRIIVREMADSLSLDLVAKHLVTNQITLTIGFDSSSLVDNDSYKGEVKIDFYGRPVPKHAHGTRNIGRWTASTKMLTDAVLKLYDDIVDKRLLIRRINVTAGRVIDEKEAEKEIFAEQTDLFTDYAEKTARDEKLQSELDRERRIQERILSIKNRYGKNAVLKGTNFQEGATTRIRNGQIGGHKA